MTPDDVRPIPGYEGLYSVARDGTIRRVAGGSGAVAGRILKPTPCDKRERPYLTVTLHGGGTPARCYVHHIVAAAFIGPRPAGHDVNHRDLNKANNAASNLEYKTRAQNIQHSYDTDAARKTARGVSHPRAKLTESAVRAIRAAPAATALERAALAARFGVSRATLYDVRAARTWAHITD